VTKVPETAKGRPKKGNPAIHIAGFEAVSIRRKKLIQKETSPSI